MMTGRRILVWDVPTRVFHWSLALAFAGAMLTADSERHRDLHILSGFTMLALIAFRLVWGLVGTRYARFGSFAYGPRALLRDLRGIATLRGERHLGHTPAGSWAMWLMLALGVLTGLSGYVVYTDGPEWVEEAHGALAWTLLAVVLVHVSGVALSSLLHRENLVGAMITGRKRGEPGQAIRGSRWLLGAALAALVLGLWLDLVPVPGLDQPRQMWSVLQPAGDRGGHEEDD
jgi:cytochrome b